MASSWKVEDSDDELEESLEARFTGKTAMIVVIDSTPKMFETWGENEETPFLAAIKCCESMWRSKVVSNAKDLVSILLTGTEKTENPSSFPNMYQLQPLSSVKVDMIKELIEMRNSPEDLNGFKDKIGSSENYDLSKLFWLANIIFDKGKTQTFAKKIMYFTCEDNPHSAQPALQQDALGKFKDLGKIEFNVVSFKNDFDFNKFYSNLIDDETSIIRSNNLNSLMKVVRMKQKLKRPLSRATFEIAPGIKIGIGYYSFVRPAPWPKYVSLNKRNNEIIQKSQSTFRTDSGMPVLKSEERKIVEVQGEQAFFTGQEIQDIKYSHTTGVKLIGFMNSDIFENFTWYRSNGYFLYPDEDRISGSKELFTALLDRCVTLQKIPLIRMVLSRGKSPKLACLIPSLPRGEEDEDDEESNEIFPQGFHVFPVPFCDEIRTVDMEFSNTPVPQEMIELMEKVVKKLTNKKFDILSVKNPALQSKWKKLEEEALEERIEDKDYCDFSEPNEELMKERLGSLPNEIEETAPRVGSYFSNTTAVENKKPKVDVAMEAQHGRLEKCTCVVLTEFLKARKITVPFRPVKATLISLVKEALNIND